MSNQDTLAFSWRETGVSKLDGRWLATLSAACFSLKAIFAKLAYAAAPIDAITLLTLRMTFALPAFLWLAFGTGGKPINRRDMMMLLGIGALGYYLSSLFDFLGLQLISAGLERLILFTYPPMVLLMESAWRKRAIPSRIWGGLAITYAGILAALGHDTHINGNIAAVIAGSGWVLLSSATYSGYYLGTAILVGRVGASRMAGYAGTIATALILVHFGFTHPVRALTSLPSHAIGWSVAMAIVSTALPIWLAALAVEKMGAGQTAAIGSLGPALTIVFGWLILGDPFSWLQLAGMSLVVAGVWWIGKAR
jgi:drug/metabolite transporter (DMT)-like permease